MIGQKRLLSMLILSAILILVLAYVGDFDEIVQQVKNKEDYVQLGKIHDCDPGIAICSVAQVIDNERIKISLGFNQKVKNMQPFEMMLKVSGVDKQKIRRVEVFFQAQGSETVPIVERFKFISGRSNLVSNWQANAEISQATNSAKAKWQAVVRVITLQENYSASFIFAVFP